jgi:hypothetical protein
MESTSIAHAAIYDAREGRPRKGQPIEITVKATEKAYDNQEYALQWMKDPTYKS